MKRYTVEAEYKVKKELTVLVEDDGDPENEKAWVEIEKESDMACWLYDIDKGTAKLSED